MNKAQLINQTSGTVEYRTAPFIVEAARTLMGGFDLDPATTRECNLEHIKANYYFDKDNSGLLRAWGTQMSPTRVWLNHPFHAGWKACDENCKRKACKKRGHIYEDIPSNADWINKLVDEYSGGRVYEACCITFASTSEKWFQPLLRYPQCFLAPRTNYYLPDGTIFKGVTKGSVVTYFGKRTAEFARIFAPHGAVKIKWDSIYART